MKSNRFSPLKEKYNPTITEMPSSQILNVKGEMKLNTLKKQRH